MFAVESKLQRADFLNRRYQINSVPQVAVNGKYVTDEGMAGGEPQLFQLIQSSPRMSTAADGPIATSRGMLNIFIQQPQGPARTTPGSPPKIPEEALWLDLLEPTADEEKLVERELGIDVPTREEMKEIETSNRLYEDNGALYMTTTVAAQLDTDRPVAMAVTFILTGSRLVTNRYLDTKPFQQFIAYAEKHPAACTSPLALLAGLMEAFTERIADVLERVGGDLDNLSATFSRSAATARPTAATCAA